MDSVPSILPETQEDSNTAIRQPDTVDAADAYGIVPDHHPPARAVTLRLPDDLYYRLKIRAAIERRSMQDIMAEAVQVYLATPFPNQPR